ncbi:DNA repair protein RecN [Syntrophotalea acetylenivorans]|uniref:DNA repair protein RecN n=1 Tax=Syntrophotalea acetylenivorans TaxID=1842532 RepID=UPI000A80D130|nr:AAA family ATPase [Syntrophotalea acetylenivorans]
MLTDLHIRDFAIIDVLEVGFSSGFNVLTGETGAGKSIIIDAVALLLGDRARVDLIRTGSEEAVVEAVFDLQGKPAVRQALAAGGFDDEEELLIKRVVNRNGRNKIYINGSLAKLAQLQPLTSQLMNIYGQHEHQGLQRADSHLAFLDSYAGLQPELDTYRHSYDDIQQLEQELQKLQDAEAGRLQRLDLLSFQLRELDEAELVAGEDEELLAERSLLQHGERLSRSALTGYETLYGAEQAVCTHLDAVAAELENSAGVDAQLSPLAETVRSSLYMLEDVAEQLRSYAGKVSFDAARLNQVEKRLALLADLQRKYAGSIDGLLAYRNDIAQESEALAHADATREELAKRLEWARLQLQQQGDVISTKRRAAAEALREAVEKELTELAMPKAQFEMRLFALPQPGPGGLERGEFYLAANLGEDSKPLAWIASGGNCRGLCWLCAERHRGLSISLRSYLTRSMPASAG